MEKSDAEMFISDYYKDRSVFITGATGFLGKVLIEKLLRSCPDVTEIFLLMRPRKGLNVNDRLKKMLSIALFDKLRAEQPSCFDKLIPITGDVTVEGLGIIPTERQQLIEKVSVVFHIAASVKFDDSLKDAIFNNTRSTRDVCILAESMKKLSVLLHVSSTYTQSDKPVVDEIFYPTDIDWRQAIKIAETVDEHILRVLTVKYMGTMPNTYIFTKRLAEQVIYDYSKKLPSVIFRPSIVVSTVDEPIKGWLDNFNGPIGMLVGGGKGILRVVHVDPNTMSDFIPVDVAIKAMIIAAWQRGIKTIDEVDDVFVYNCSSYDLKPIDIKRIVKTGLQIVRILPFDDIIWTPHTMLTKSGLKYYIIFLLTHILPALFIDGIMKLLGKRQILLKLQRKIYISNNVLSYFLMNQWKFYNYKLLNLLDDLNEKNRIDFGYDYSDINIEDYLTNGLIGAKLYLFKEDMNRLEAAKLHDKRMYWLDKIMKALFIVIIIWIFYRNNILFYITEIVSSVVKGLTLGIF